MGKPNTSANCKQCGKPFLTKKHLLEQGKGMFCSNDCYNEYRKKRMPEIVCETCCKVFKVNSVEYQRNKPRFCSHKCHAQTTVNRVENQCATCGKTFTRPKSKPATKYCSIECKNLGLRRDSVKETRQCACGLEFTVWRSSKKKWCSIKCYRINRSPQEDHVCDCCGKSFKAHKSRQVVRYCSPDCAYRKMRGEGSAAWKGGTTDRNLANFETYASKLDFVEDVRRDPEEHNILQVRCKRCGKWYRPSRTSVRLRAAVLETKLNGNFNLYCSDSCKESCPIYGKSEEKFLFHNSPKYEPPQGYRKEFNSNDFKFWADSVKCRAEWQCEICGSIEDLVAHHIQPVKTNTFEALDLGNGICLCKSCHNKYGHRDECSTGSLASKIC